MSDAFLQFLTDNYGDFNDRTVEICRLIDPITSPSMFPYSNTRLAHIFNIHVPFVFVDDPLGILVLHGYQNLIVQVKELYAIYRPTLMTVRKVYELSPREIYVFKARSDSNVFKIGVSKNIEKRSRAYKTAIPDFKILYCQPVCDVVVEKLVHHALDPYRVDKHEFFNVSLDVIIETIRQTNAFFNKFRQMPGDEYHLIKMLTSSS